MFQLGVQKEAEDKEQGEEEEEVVEKEEEPARR